jgi:hypothetical protein
MIFLITLGSVSFYRRTCKTELLFLKGILTNPHRFECVAEVRSAHRAEMIKRELLEASNVFEPFEVDLSAEDKAFLMKMRQDIKDDLRL